MRDSQIKSLWFHVPTNIYERLGAIRLATSEEKHHDETFMSCGNL